MKKIFTLLIIAGSLNATSHENKVANSINIYNPFHLKKELWINGNIHSISPTSYLWVPCMPEEKFEIQSSNTLETMICGDFKELKNND